MKYKIIVTVFVIFLLTACTSNVSKQSTPTTTPFTATATPVPTPRPAKLPDQKVWKQLKTLEKKALDYTKNDIKEANKMVVRFVRMGHDNYKSDVWQLLAGKDDKKFSHKLPTSLYSLQRVEYIQDTANEGRIDFPHLCASLNLLIPYYAMSTEMCDIGSWLGDSLELMEQLKQSGYAKSQYKKLASKLLARDDSRFNTMDLRADVDANNIRSSMDVEKDSIIDAMKRYYENLPRSNRYDLFLKTRFPDVQTKKGLKHAIWNYLGGEPGLLTTKLYEEHDISIKDKELVRAVSDALAERLWKLAHK